MQPTSKSLVRQFLGWLAERDRQYRALSVVENLDARLLEDLGLTRSELRDAVKGLSVRHVTTKAPAVPAMRRAA